MDADGEALAPPRFCPWRANRADRHSMAVPSDGQQALALSAQSRFVGRAPPAVSCDLWMNAAGPGGHEAGNGFACPVADSARPTAFGLCAPLPGRVGRAPPAVSCDLWMNAAGPCGHRTGNGFACPVADSARPTAFGLCAPLPGRRDPACHIAPGRVGRAPSALRDIRPCTKNHQKRRSRRDGQRIHSGRHPPGRGDAAARIQWLQRAASHRSGQRQA